MATSRSSSSVFRSQYSVESPRIKIARNRLAELRYLLQEIYFSAKTLNIILPEVSLIFNIGRYSFFVSTGCMP